MSHDNEYHDALVDVLELVWGTGYMAPGGPGNVDRMVDGIDLAGKHVLDIGSGIGGPAFHLVKAHGARVTCIDLEAPLIARAQKSAAELGIDDRMAFQTVEIGPLPFPDGSFDLVFSSGAFTQTEDKVGMFAEVMRVLTPRGWFSTYDWLKTPGPYSDLMLEWFRLEGLTYAMRTLEDYESLLNNAGFVSIAVADESEWYRAAVQEEYQLLAGPYYQKMVDIIGKNDADHFVKNWRVMAMVCERGEMRQGYIRGQKPA